VMHACILWALDDWLLRDTESDVMQRRTNWSSVERAEPRPRISKNRGCRRMVHNIGYSGRSSRVRENG
jgi:hypothetical protein